MSDYLTIFDQGSNSSHTFENSTVSEVLKIFGVQQSSYSTNEYNSLINFGKNYPVGSIDITLQKVLQ